MQPHERCCAWQALAFRRKVQWYRFRCGTFAARSDLTWCGMSLVRGFAGAECRRLARTRARENLHGVSRFGLYLMLVSEGENLFIDCRVFVGTTSP